MTDQPQPLDLDAIEARANAATPGPWQWHISRRTRDYRLQTAGWDVVMGFARWGMQSAQPEFNIDGVLHNGADLDQPHPDAEFIAHARKDVDDLVAEIRRLTAELQQVQQQTAARIATEIRQYCPDHGEADTCRIDCHCEIADEITRLYTPHAHPCTDPAAMSGA